MSSRAARRGITYVLLYCYFAQAKSNPLNPQASINDTRNKQVNVVFGERDIKYSQRAALRGNYFPRKFRQSRFLGRKERPKETPNTLIPRAMTSAPAISGPAKDTVCFNGDNKFRADVSRARVDCEFRRIVVRYIRQPSLIRSDARARAKT